MNQLIKLLLINLVLLSTVSFTVGQKESSDGIGKKYELKSGKIVMTISACGGRIISFKYGKKEMLTQSTEHENFGSTLWTSPQSEWGWPPFVVLDSLPYHVIQKDKILKMISQPDPKSGFQFEKTWQLVGAHCIRIEYQIRNISDKSRGVGAWEVTRVPSGGIAFFPEGKPAKIPESTLKSDLQQQGINWFIFDRRPIESNEKSFSAAYEGWLAYIHNGLVFMKQFPDISPENYSPQQGEVEIYVNKEKSYIELENHGTYTQLLPGEFLSYVVNWNLLPLPRNIKPEIGNPEISSFVRQQLKNDKNHD